MMAAAGGAFEQGLAHLGASGVLATDEENGAHAVGIIALTDVS
jgi:hypothetical protein